MKVKVLFNSSALSEELSRGWGVSFLVNGSILFDTGEKEEYLQNNLQKLKIDLRRIKAIVISHDHWDHTGGLGSVLKQRPDIPVYGCSGFREEFKEAVRKLNGRFMDNQDFCEIADNIFLTGEIKCIYKETELSEQAMVIRTDNGLTVITGCAHPGVLKILKKVKDQFPGGSIYSVFGGFHLAKLKADQLDFIVDEFKKMRVQKVGPTHCSGTSAENIFRDVYRDDFFTVKSGEIIEV